MKHNFKKCGITKILPFLVGFSLAEPSAINCTEPARTNLEGILADSLEKLEANNLYDERNYDGRYIDRTSQELIERFVHENKQSKHVLAIDKTARRLYFFEDGKLNHEYPIKVAFGANYKHRKEKRDGGTPEGEYKIFWKKAHDVFDPNQPKTSDYTNFTYFLGINYPNEADALHGLVNGFIGRKTYEDIVRRVKNGSTNWDTTLGGPVGIHTIPTGMDTSVSATSNDWTKGCIAVNYTQMKKLYNEVPVGTPVIILGTELKSP